MKEGEDSHPEALLSLCLMMLTDIIEFYKCLKSLSGPWLLWKIQKKKKDLYNIWFLVRDRMVWVFRNLLTYWDFPTVLSPGCTHNGLKKKREQLFWVVVWCQRSEQNQAAAERKAKVTQITTCYNQVMKTTTTTSYSSWRSHHVPLLSAKTGNWHYKLHSYSSSRCYWSPDACLNHLRLVKHDNDSNGLHSHKIYVVKQIVFHIKSAEVVWHHSLWEMFPAACWN